MIVDWHNRETEQVDHPTQPFGAGTCRVTFENDEWRGVCIVHVEGRSKEQADEALDEILRAIEVGTRRNKVATAITLLTGGLEQDEDVERSAGLARALLVEAME